MAVFCSFQEAQFETVIYGSAQTPIALFWSVPGLIMLGGVIWIFFPKKRALKRDEPWKVFLVLCPVTRDEVAGFDDRQFRFSSASVFRVGASGVEAATTRDVYC